MGPVSGVVAWTAGCMWRCLYCHNPDTWTMTNGIPVTIASATEELRKYRHGLKVMAGGFTLSGGEPLMQASLRGEALDCRARDGDSHGARHQRILRQPPYRRRARPDRSRAARHQGVESGAPQALDRDGRRADAGFRAPPCAAETSDLAALCPGARPDRRRRRHWPDGEFAAELGNVERVDVLPFHQMGRYKWEKLGIPYTLGDTSPPAKN